MREYKYALRLKDSESILKCKVIGLSGNGETKSIYELAESGNEEWVMPNVEDVKAALEENVPWYQSSYNKPVIKYAKYNLEIVQINSQKLVEKYNEYADQEKDSEYHKNRVEMVLKMLSVDEEKAITAKAAAIDKTNLTQQNQNSFRITVPESPSLDLNSDLIKVKETNFDQASVGTENQIEVKSFLQTKEKEQERVEPVKQLVKGITKIKVRCCKSIPKEWGSLEIASMANCFQEGQMYLGYTKNGKFYVINEDKVPEFICNDSEEKKWEDNFFFRTHFDIVEYIK